MRFPLRLSLDLARVAIAQKLFGVVGRPLSLHLDLARFSAQPDAALQHGGNDVAADSSRDAQTLTMVRASNAPIVWIGGDTPLHYPRIGHLTREIINLGRTVFIEMDGRLLRRRIHEFRPEPRLYLVLPIMGLQEAHDLRAAHSGSFRATLESIRAAKLSGFHICVETPISADTDLAELRDLTQFVATLDVDGWIQKRISVATPPSKEILASARDLTPSRGWRSFSRQLTRDVGHSEFASGDTGKVSSASQTKPGNQVNSELAAREESVRAL